MGMADCAIQANGDIELYFYGELSADERRAVERHVPVCAECRQALEELKTIGAALAARPHVDAPEDGDWSGFMERLDQSIAVERETGPAASVVAMPARPPVQRYAAYLAMAALLTIVTSAVVAVIVVSRQPQRPQPVEVAHVDPEPTPAIAEPAPGPPPAPEAAFASMSEEHFERSKLVVLGIANKDPHAVTDADWEFERGLASNLLSDTRLYRRAAEARGMKTLADVMGDLEIVLLQTSLADTPEPGALEQIQRLIHKRDLVSKMDVATTGS
jgi:hypothetical protein